MRLLVVIRDHGVHDVVAVRFIPDSIREDLCREIGVDFVVVVDERSAGEPGSVFLHGSWIVVWEVDGSL